MSKAFITDVLRDSAGLTHSAAQKTATDLIDAIVDHLKLNGQFSLVGFGTFTVKETKARVATNPRTGAKVEVAAGKTVRFKASPALRKDV